ncbi:MAG TPA: helix-turn-helix domain-containing protein [Clostridiaceae bacterium]|nr:helix-turn-helix domain-containing protein [Clostridiaceae bacterium]
MSNVQSSEFLKIIGKNIKYYRKLYNLEKGKMTQEKLAELTDVSIALIGNLESEKIDQGISVFTLWKISKALEIPIENLFNGIDNDNNSLQA